MISYISSRQNKIVKFASSLKENKFRNEHKMFLMEGIKNLKEALKFGQVQMIFSLHEIQDTPNEIPLYIVTEEVIQKLTKTKNPEGVVFVVKMFDDLFPSRLNKILYLDDIQDPGNMGTIIRTALAFSFDCIFTSSKCVSIYNDKVIAASKGAFFQIPIIEKDFSQIKHLGKVIVSSLNEDSISLSSYKIDDKPFILVLGNEAHGVKKEIIEIADLKIKIPMSNIDSLNVSVAAGILMFELTKLIN